MTAPPSGSGPGLDHARRALLVPRRLIPAILAIHVGDTLQEPATLAELETGGIVAAGHLDPLVTALIDTMTNPALVVTVEIATGSEERPVTIWASPLRAVVGTSSDRRQFELLEIDPGLLPFHLAQATGLSPRPPTPFTGGCLVPATALQSAEALIADHPHHATAILRAAGLSHDWADRVSTALVHRRAMWTVESVWLRRDDGKTQSSLRVLDAGGAGYWRLTAGKTSDTVSLSVTGFDELLGFLFALLPGRCHR